jgi:retinol dehydrogenase-12
MGLQRFCTQAVLVVVLAISAAPLYLSHVAGGWLSKYTSPTPFYANMIPRLDGKVAIVTGANTGIGFETAKELARNGAEVILAARSAGKGEAAAAALRAELGPATKVRFLPLDLSSFRSVKKFAVAFERLNLPLHILVNNAGVMKSPGAGFVGRSFTYGFELTADGFESHIGVNHLAHFYLTTLLVPKLKASAPARVIAVSSAAEAQAYAEGIRFDLWETRGADYEDGNAYGQSKLSNILFARELAKRLEGSGVTAYSCHPGIIETELARYMEAEMAVEAVSASAPVKALNALGGTIMSLALMTAPDGALTQLYLATASELPVNGGYYAPLSKVAVPVHPQAGNATLQKLLWEQSERAIAAKVGFGR